MKFFLPLRHGLATAARRPKLILLVYLLSLLPAAVVALLAYLDMAGLMNDSLFAGLALAGERMAVWNDYQRADASGFGMVNQAALILAGFAVLLHILTAAGVVEALLHREHERERPFLLGIGRHGWRFTRSAIWFGIAVVKMAEFCLITPPIGLNCFVVAGVRDDLSVQDVFKGVTPFFIADAITIALLVAFPAIVLWLPSHA